VITLYLSVHDIVDVILRRGHLDNRVFNRASMQEGSRLHSLYQGDQDANYQAEYPLEGTYSSEDFLFCVNGKADGVILSETGSLTVEEIKTTVEDLDTFIKDHGEWHLGQALFYADMLSREEGHRDVTVLMTYLKQSNYHIRKQIRKTYTFEDLELFTADIVARYSRYWKKIQAFKDARDKTVKERLSFPFATLRPGQKTLVDFVTEAAEKKKQVFVEAPTGIGKTVSILYPLVKRFGEKKADRIYYLTGKNSIKKVAMDTLSLFTAQGVTLKCMEYTAKENLCLNDKKSHCNPVECPFARNYYDKLLDAVFDALNETDTFDRKTLTDFAVKRTMCPYQFQLDLGRYCDVNVCDYSYVYDVYDQLGLEMEGTARTHSLLCVDECHNLPDRVRDMYTSELYRSTFEDALSLCTGKEFALLRESIRGAIKAYETIPVPEEDENLVPYHLFLVQGVPEKLRKAVHDVNLDVKDLLKKRPELVTDPLLSFFYQTYGFEMLDEFSGDNHLADSFLFYVRVDGEGNTESVKIAALDSRPIIQRGSDLFETAVFFSATLEPRDYYLDLLGGNPEEKDSLLVLPSPFPKENRRIFVDTRHSLCYRDRKMTLPDVYAEIKTAVSVRKGNYFVYVPSYEYLESLRACFEDEPIPEAEVYFQGRVMPEGEREAFLDRFRPDNPETTIGVLVLGGIFAEGIDLVGERLIGCIVLSVGLPQIGFERDQLKKYYDRRDEADPKGFLYAYTYPGINRILQAAGRVIRTENDRGFVLFVDARLKGEVYRKIEDQCYPDRIRIFSASQLRMALVRFWEEEK